MAKSNDNFLTGKRPRKEVFSGRIINVGIEEVKNANGDISEFEIIHHPGGATIAAINHNNQVCLLKQFRHAIDRWIWELPAGKLEDNETPGLSAMRELEEEAGVTAKSWQNLGMIYSSPGVFNEKLYLYLAQSLTNSHINLESHEFIEVHWIPLESAYQWALDNTISDAKSVIGIIRAYQHLTKYT